MAFPIGAAIGAAGSILGGLFGSSGGGKKMAIKGARINARTARWASKQNLKWQRKFAKQSVRWRMKDAKKAGINPLAAMGMQGMSFSPSFVGGSPGDGYIEAGRMASTENQGFGEAIARAATALGDGFTREQQTAAQMQMTKLQLENAQLQNTYLASQIARINQAGSPPPRPAMDQAQMVVPGSNIARTDQPFVEKNVIPDVVRVKTPNGYAVLRSEQAADRLDDDWLGNIQAFVRRSWMSATDPALTVPPEVLKGGKVPVYNPITGETTLYDRNDFPPDKVYGVD